MRYRFWPSVALVLGMLLCFSTPIAAQYPPSRQPENPARKAAALADYRKSCANNIAIYVAEEISKNPSAREHADYLFTHYRQRDYNFESGLLRGADDLRRFLAQEVAGAARHNDRSRIGVCVYEVALRHALHGVPGFDHGVGGGSSSTPAPSPKAAPKAAATAEKLPAARPAKMAPWSPNAMSTNPKQALSAQFAAERADALASCSAPIGRYAAHHKITSAQANFLVEQVQLQDRSIDNGVQVFRDHIANMQRQIAAGNLPPGDVIARQIAVCTFGRRVAQLEGSPLATGAVDGTLNPLSIGSPGTQWKQQGKDARIIASDGESAGDCVKLIELTKTDSSTSGGGRVLSNQCSGPVEIVWCYSPGDCDTETGAGWTVQAGKSWPVSAVKEIRWAACHGRDTASFVKGSHGLRHYCRAPAKK